MLNEQLLHDSDDLASSLAEVLLAPKYDASTRIRVSHLACSVSLEHSHAARLLLAQSLVPSGLVVLRAQYEALVRAVWTLYAASDAHVEKLSATLDVEAEQAAKNLPLVQDMMTALSTKAPPQALHVLANFKDSSWKALNSYAHAGIHPIQRYEAGHPLELVEQVLKNSNGLAVVAGMQAAVLTGNQELVRRVGLLQASHHACLPAK
jgi:hypothetical protein